MILPGKGSRPGTWLPSFAQSRVDLQISTLPRPVSKGRHSVSICIRAVESEEEVGFEAIPADPMVRT